MDEINNSIIAPFHSWCLHFSRQQLQPIKRLSALQPSADHHFHTSQGLLNGDARKNSFRHMLIILQRGVFLSTTLRLPLSALRIVRRPWLTGGPARRKASFGIWKSCVCSLASSWQIRRMGKRSGKRSRRKESNDESGKIARDSTTSNAVVLFSSLRG